MGWQCRRWQVPPVVSLMVLGKLSAKSMRVLWEGASPLLWCSLRPCDGEATSACGQVRGGVHKVGVWEGGHSESTQNRGKVSTERELVRKRKENEKLGYSLGWL